MPVETERRRVKEPDVRRQELLDASVRVFAEKGVNRATIADITQAAGVAKGTFYLYFSSKEHLLAGLKERLVDEILEHATALNARVGQDDWDALLLAVVESYVDFMQSRQDMIQVLVQEGMTPETNELFAECEHRIDEMFAAAIRVGMDSGEFHCSDPEMTARLIHHAFDGTLIDSLLYHGGIDRERFIAAATELVKKALGPPPPPKDIASG